MGDASVARRRAFHPPISDLLLNCERSVNEHFSRWRCCQEPGTLRKPTQSPHRHCAENPAPWRCRTCPRGAVMSREQEYVLRTVEERGVRLIRLWFTDVLGQLKSVAISPAELEQVFNEGVQFDGTAIDGFSRVHEADVLARPDATTFELLPWAKADEPSGRMFCNIESLDDTPFWRGSPTDPATQPRCGPREGVHLLRRAGSRVLLLRVGETEVVLPSRSTTPRISISQPPMCRAIPQDHDPHARGDGHPGRVLVPRGLARASTRSTSATPRHSAWRTTS